MHCSTGSKTEDLRRGRGGVFSNCTEQRRRSISIVELHEQDGLLTCDRDAPIHVELVKPEK
jgi:hypothetical protein